MLVQVSRMSSRFFDMRLVKHNSIMPEIVKGREGNADVANKACLGSDLVKEWDDVRTVRGRGCRNKNVRKSKAIVGIQSEMASLCTFLLMRRSAGQRLSILYRKRGGDGGP